MEEGEKQSKNCGCKSTKILEIDVIKEDDKRNCRQKRAQAVIYRACLLLKTSVLSKL